jgi:hypothetical protein
MFCVQHVASEDLIVGQHVFSADLQCPWARAPDHSLGAHHLRQRR